jgi:hypothetical protein
MKKKLRRLSLDRETVRRLTPESLALVAGGGPTGPTNTDSYANSCDRAAASLPRTACLGPTDIPAVCCPTHEGC